MTARTCAWCDGPMPTLKRSHGTDRRIYCSRECDIARRNKRDYYAEEVAFLASTGAAPVAIARQLNVKPGALARSLERAGRNDLALIMRPLADTKPCPDCDATIRRQSKRCRACHWRQARGAA